MHQRLDASAFLPELGNQQIHGTILLTNFGLRFESEEVTLEFPMGRLMAEVRAGGEERITFTDPGRPGAEVFTSELGLLGSPAPPLVQARENYSARLSRGELKRRWRLLGAF